MPNNNPAFESIPILEMNRFLSNDERERDKFVGMLRDVCHNIGFFYLTNHGLTPSDMTQMLNLTEAFFDSPQEEKNKIDIALSPHYRGYGKLNTEITQGVPDYKETYDLGLEHPAIHEIPADRQFLMLRGPNQWPVSETLRIQKWKETVQTYISSMQKIGEQLMRAVALALKIPENYFATKFSADSEDSYAALRLLRYPPGRKSENQNDLEFGVGPHIDMGCLVILLQDQVGGLQVQNRSGQWVEAPPMPGAFVVNIGQMLQIWSNNYFLATPHRVINRSSRIRHSIPFFLEPNLSTVVSPLKLPPELIAELKQPQVNPNTRVVYGEHMLRVYKRSFPS